MENAQWLEERRKGCSMPGCGNNARCRGLCDTHYSRWLRHGDPSVARAMRQRGTGCVRPSGYLSIQTDRRRSFEHVRIAESVLGKPLPAGAVVHHADGNRGNNEKGNLVICQDAAYHNLLHMRMRAVSAGFPAHYRMCIFCKGYDDPANLNMWRNSPRHNECRRERRMRGAQRNA